MNSYAVRAGLLSDHRGRDDARLDRLPRLADRRDVVDIDVEPCGHKKIVPQRSQRTLRISSNFFLGGLCVLCGHFVVNTTLRIAPDLRKLGEHSSRIAKDAYF